MFHEVSILRSVLRDHRQAHGSWFFGRESPAAGRDRPEWTQPPRGGRVPSTKRVVRPRPPARRKDLCPGPWVQWVPIAPACDERGMAWSGMVWHGMGHGSMGKYLVLVAVGVPTPEEEISQSHERGRALTGRHCANGNCDSMQMGMVMANDDGEMHTTLSPTLPPADSTRLALAGRCYFVSIRPRGPHCHPRDQSDELQMAWHRHSKYVCGLQVSFVVEGIRKEGS